MEEMDGNKAHHRALVDSLSFVTIGFLLGFPVLSLGHPYGVEGSHSGGACYLCLFSCLDLISKNLAISDVRIHLYRKPPSP